jgi:hypothetical protein
MAVRNTSGSSHGSLFAVLKTAAHELRDLQARQHELNKRIRSVRSAVHALQRLHPAQTVEPAKPVVQNGPTSSVHDADELLVRACRIALLETYDPLSVDEIYARIVRRGSFHFSNAASAKSAITWQLDAMVSQGEVLRIISDYQTKWQRV